ncbi:LPS O-antigen length regulator [Hahella sp. CCB-MM4]|nr:LPS O-antigen length regulator [Hahella sp. CCB-MM4]
MWERASENKRELDLFELISVLWAGKWVIILFAAVFAGGAVFYSLSLPDKYESEVTLAPAVEQKSAFGSLAGQFGGLTGLAGISFGGSGSDKLVLSLEVLKSREFIGKFIQAHDLMVPLLAAKGWDASSNSLVINEKVFDVNTQQWIRKVKPPAVAQPTLLEATRAFQAIMAVTQDKQTGMVYLAVEYFSPDLAQQWVMALVEDINKEMKNRDLLDAKKSISYLEAQVEKTVVADAKAMLYQLIEEQTKKVMFAEIRDEYVFKIVDPAIVPEERSRPKRFLIVFVGGFAGMMIAVLAVLVRYFNKK